MIEQAGSHPPQSFTPGLVSVIIPAYDAARFIEATIRSALDQTYPSLEVVVVDDGSKDDTAAIVARLAAAEPRVVFLTQKNQGASCARNAGIDAAKGEYLAFLDADDLWRPEKIERQVQVFRSGPPDLGLVYTWTRMIDVEGKVDGFTGATSTKKGWVINDLLVDNFVSNGSVALVHRRALHEKPYFDNRQRGNEDYYFYCRIAARHQLDYTPGFLVGYRWNTGANHSADLDRLNESHKVVIGKLCDEFDSISSRALRWSRCAFLLGCARQHFKKNNALAAANYAIRCLMIDPTCLVSPPFRRLPILAIRWALRKAMPARGPKVDFLSADPLKRA